MPKRWPTLFLLAASLGAILPALLRDDPPQLAEFPRATAPARSHEPLAFGRVSFEPPALAGTPLNNRVTDDGETTAPRTRAAGAATTSDEPINAETPTTHALAVGSTTAAAGGPSVAETPAPRAVAAGFTTTLADGEDGLAADGAGTSNDAPDWPWTAPRRPDVPALAEGDRNAIDAFVRRRLEAADLSPNPDATRVDWLRRATFDLHGLPPSPEELDSFVADTADGAYERVVERLLASPRYGEAWGRHWLDVVRYAETNGFERDAAKPWIWRYRDWVIDAFNADMPYDEFMRQQLAGDELDDPTSGSRIATGYYRILPWDDEPGQGELQGRYDVLADVVATTAQAFLGLSLGCARCHDHVADPLPTVDYYRFMAFFHGLTDMSVDGYVEDVASATERADAERRAAERDAEVAGLQRSLRDVESDVRIALLARDGAPADSSRIDQLSWRAFPGTWDDFAALQSWQARQLGSLADGRLDIDVGAGPRGIRYDGELLVDRDGEAGFRLQASGRTRLTVNGHVLAEVGPEGGTIEVACHLRAGPVPLRVETLVGTDRAQLSLAWRRVSRERWRYTTTRPGGDWTNPSYDDSGWLVGGPSFGVDTDGAWADTPWTANEIWLRGDVDWPFPRQAFGLAARHDEGVRVFVNGRAAAAATGVTTEFVDLPLSAAGRLTPREGHNTLAVHCRQTSGGPFLHVRPYDLRMAAGLPLADVFQGWMPLSVDRLRHDLDGASPLVASRGAEVIDADALDGYLADASALGAARALTAPRRLAAVVQEQDEIAELFVHRRGSAENLGQPVEPGFPGVFGAAAPRIEPTAGSSGRRRALAEWIGSPDHALTARVAVNRIWQHHFGRGLVTTPNDFGALGARPSHPELLDYLATELAARGWSSKAMHRLIMLSSTYRQSASPRADGAARDAGNRLLWRFSPRRLTAEELRDAMLTMTGRLNTETGGPSFHAPLPDEVLATSSRPDQAPATSPESQANRRSIYMVVKRSLPHPLLEVFDVPDTDSSCPVRTPTIQPTQPLSMLNGADARGYAALFAGRLAADAGIDPAARIERAYRLAFSRAVRDDELQRHLAWIAENPDDTAAWVDFCLLVLNLNEFAYLD